jgi:uncharacterized protein YbjT (DUF2867 family)
MIDPADVAAVAAVALSSEGHEGSIWMLTGPDPLNYDDIAGHLSAVLGRRIEYVDVTEEQARSSLAESGMPEWLVSNLVTLFRLIRQSAMAHTTDSPSRDRT